MYVYPPGGSIDDYKEDSRLKSFAAGEFDMLTFALLVFHLAHCATECAAPKLWAKLK